MLDEVLGEDHLQIAKGKSVANIEDEVDGWITPVIDVDPAVEVNRAAADMKPAAGRQSAAPVLVDPLACGAPQVAQHAHSMTSPYGFNCSMITFLSPATTIATFDGSMYCCVMR